jgi:hypothetical protein
MSQKDDFPVSSTGELSVGGGPAADRPRKLGEFKPTNAPLSAADLEHRRAHAAKKRKRGWIPRTTENIGELTPIPEDKPTKQ